MLLRVLPAALAASALLAIAPVGTAATHTLTGTTGPGYSIKLTMNGKTVKSLKAGTYSIVVHDKSDFHNFHVFGPGVNKKTSISFVGTKTLSVTLKKGKYTYQCDAHATQGMKASLTVT
jgi:plastocyanin